MVSRQDDILDVSRIDFAGSFNHQVKEMLARVRLTRDEVQNVPHLLDDLTGTLSHWWPGTAVHPFGSVVTGLGIKTSDVDCYIDVPPQHGLDNPIQYAKNLLNKDKSRYAQTFAITTARVPILKFIHVPTGYNCDINFSSMGGVRNSKLIAFLLNMDQRALHLAVILKYWSKVYHFTGTNLMSNYALTLMVIFYLQVRTILPSVVELRRHTHAQYVEGWNTAFNDDLVHKSDNVQSLYELLGDFFSFYRNFDYERLVISPYMGQPVLKENFRDFNNLSQVYRLYKENVCKRYCSEIKLDTSVCIQDPFDHSRNCTVAVFPKLFNKIKGLFDLAYKAYLENDCNDFLKAMFTINVPPSLQIINRGKPGQHKLRGVHKNMRQARQQQQKQQLRKHYIQWQKYKCFQNPP